MNGRLNVPGTRLATPVGSTRSTSTGYVKPSPGPVISMVNHRSSTPSTGLRSELHFVLSIANLGIWLSKPSPTHDLVRASQPPQPRVLPHIHSRHRLPQPRALSIREER